jgi:hypothetical protein
LEFRNIRDRQRASRIEQFYEKRSAVNDSNLGDPSSINFLWETEVYFDDNDVYDIYPTKMSKPGKSFYNSDIMSFLSARRFEKNKEILKDEDDDDAETAIPSTPEVLPPVDTSALRRKFFPVEPKMKLGVELRFLR